MTHPVEVAVMPLKSAAINRAEKVARQIVADVVEELKAANWDRQIVAPYPNSLHDSRQTYHQKLSKYRLVHSFTKSIDSMSRRMNSPDPCEIKTDLVERFVNNSKEIAAAQYDAFIAKLVKKIGDCETAVLTGEHVWSYSILKVTKANNVVEHWKTTMIINVSKLGKLFNQWPTRKMK